MDGLKIKHRSGRPPEVSEETSAIIRRELSERTGVKFHEVHIYRLLHKWGFSPKVPRMRFVELDEILTDRLSLRALKYRSSTALCHFGPSTVGMPFE